MEERTTYVGLDVHKRMINIALLRPATRAPVTWDVPNEPEAIRHFTRKLAQLTDGAGRVLRRSGPVWLRAATAAPESPDPVSGDRTVVDSAQARRPNKARISDLAVVP